MKLSLKVVTALFAAAVILVGTVFTAVAARPALRAGSAVQSRIEPAPAAATCTKLQASDIAWVTLTSDGEVDEQVDSYPSGTDTITPVFEYPCNPKKATIILNIYYNGESIGQIKDSLVVTKKKGFFGIPISYEDGSALDEGTWAVEYVAGKTVLTKGEVVVGEGQAPDSEGLTVFGTVTDKKTKKPIKGAVVLVLNPGVTVEDFVDGGQKPKDVFALAKTDSKGQYTLLDPKGEQEQLLERNVEYSLIVVAKGYKPLAGDGVVIDDTAENPLQVDFQMTK